MDRLAHLHRLANRDLLLNAASMIGTTVITAGLGFVYWWLAARQFSQEAVGFASALISAMSLLGTLGMVGMGTLLIGELPRQPEQRAPLVTTALVVAGGVSALLGIIFALIAPQVSLEFRALAGGGSTIMLFTAGVVLTAITLVLDQAMIGLLHGELQLWRNALFALGKLIMLWLIGLWAVSSGALSIYTTWTLGNAASIVGLGLIAALVGIRIRIGKPRRNLLQNLPGAALGHHALNLALQLPALALPVLVTTILSATLNAGFYISWLLLHLVFAVPYTLTTVLYAAGVADQAAFAHKIRLTLGLAVVLGVLSNIVLWLGADIFLGIFGRAYAEQAGWSLRLMGLGVFPLIIKDHFIAIRRVHQRIPRTAVLATIGSALELGGAAAGASVGGLAGLSVGFVLALCVEAAWMIRTVYLATALGELKWSRVSDAGVAPMEQMQ
jgi:O-antigen/teichoic acid export membrane protein